MVISYDTNIKIAGLGLTPWSRLGPERWLPHYTIASMYGWGMTAAAPDVVLHDLTQKPDLLPTLVKQNMPSLLQTEAYQRMLNEELDGYDLFAYKAMPVPESLAHRKFLVPDVTIAQKFENKAAFRQMMHDSVPFPPYRILERAELDKSRTCYEALLDGRKSIVLQDEALSGGRGSFVVRSYDQYCAAIDTLDKLSSKSRVVISDVIEHARERSIQACVTKYGVFTGPLQRQIIVHPSLVYEAAAGNKFCGVQICESDQRTATFAQAQQIAQRVGAALQAAGYRGIFGMDFLVSEAGELFAIEVNPRTTGTTPLLTALSGDGHKAIPFLLLHLLELGGYDYTIDDDTIEFASEGSMFMVRSLAHEALTVSAVPQSGTYAYMNGQLTRVSSNLDLARIDQSQCILQLQVEPGSIVKPSGRFVSIQLAKPVMKELTDEFLPSTDTLINDIRQLIVAQ